MYRRCIFCCVACREGCTGQYICSGYKGLVAYRTQWQLPTQLPCRRCKLMWTYLTAHNCWWVAALAYSRERGGHSAVDGSHTWVPCH